MNWPRRGAAELAWGLALVLGLAVACGESETPEITGARMGAPLEPDAHAKKNRPPRIESLRLKPRAPQSGGSIVAHAQATDPDGDKTWILYEWTVDGARASASQNRLPLQLVSKGARVEVRAIPTDGQSQGEAVRATTKVVNALPRVTSAEYDLNPPVRRGQTLGVVAQGDDADLEDKDQLKFYYRWYVNGNPSGNRDRSFNTRTLRSGDRIHVRVVAYDGEDRGEPFDTLPISLDTLPPEITSTPETALRDDGTFRYQVEARDGDGDRGLRFELAKAPEGMGIDPVLGDVNWTPGPGQVGKHLVEIHVVDSEGSKGGQLFEITVSEPQPEEEAASVPASPRRY